MCFPLAGKNCWSGRGPRQRPTRCSLPFNRCPPTVFSRTWRISAESLVSTESSTTRHITADLPFTGARPGWVPASVVRGVEAVCSVIRLDLGEDDAIAPEASMEVLEPVIALLQDLSEQERRTLAELINQFAQEETDPERQADGLGNARDPGPPGLIDDLRCARCVRSGHRSWDNECFEPRVISSRADCAGFRRRHRQVHRSTPSVRSWPSPVPGWCRTPAGRNPW